MRFAIDKGALGAYYLPRVTKKIQCRWDGWYLVWGRSMLDQLVIARSYMAIDHVDLVRAGEWNCQKRTLFSRVRNAVLRVRSYGRGMWRARAAQA